jgi:P27 family predicted phage terminase small subunit
VTKKKATKKKRQPERDSLEYLSAEAREWYGKLRAEWGIEDQVGQLTLMVGMEAFDRMRQAQELIREHGQLVADRFGQLKPNPANTVERDSRAAMLAALRQLGIDEEPE